MKLKHPVFHVSLLDSAHLDTLETTVLKGYIEADEEYEVEND